MIDVPDVSGWEEKFWFSTGGTRAKKYLEKPDGGLYYFKRSAEKPATETKPGKYFRFEFWSEIIAYRVGTLLGFDVLEYVPAIDGENAGCLCVDMINSGNEELIGGIQYLQGEMPTFDPSKNENRVHYTFQLIERSLEKYGLTQFMPNIVEMIVFDAIIGNSDRHQENWALITEFTPLTRQVGKFVKIIDKVKNPSARKNLKDIFSPIYDVDTRAFTPEFQQERLTAGKKVFAPLFDNGSSLGRELEHSRVQQLITDDSKLQKYILKKGTSSIHWNQQEISHFALLEELMQTEYREKLISVIERVREKFDGREIENAVWIVDSNLPSSHSAYTIPETRKRLIVNLITSRYEKLIQIYNAGI